MVRRENKINTSAAVESFYFHFPSSQREMLDVMFGSEAWCGPGEMWQDERNFHTNEGFRAHACSRHENKQGTGAVTCAV